MTEVRRARAEDGGAIAALHEEALRFLLPAGMRMTVIVDPEAFAAASASLIAEHGGVVVGACRLDGGDLSVLVAPGHRGAGVGRALVEAAREELRAQGRERAGGWIAGDDPDALAFAARLGFLPTGATRGHGSKEAPEVRVEAGLGDSVA